MRWLLLVVSCYGIVCSVSSAPAEDDDQPYLKVNTKRTMYNVGEKKAIYCEGHNVDGELEWYFPNEKKIPPRSPDSKRIFVEQQRPADGATYLPMIIHNVALSDSGTYTCRAGDLKATIDIFVGEKVVMNESEQSYTAEEGGSINLSCQAKGTPVPDVQWYRDSVPIVDNEKYRITYKNKSSTSILRINNLTHLDPGTYICKATQEKFSHFAEKTCHLNVQHKPVIFSEAEVFAIEGEWKNISCKAIASPPPIFSWSRHGVTYDDPMTDVGEDYKIITTQDPIPNSVLMLHITNETLGAQYKCTAQNSRGRQNVMFHVSLGNKPDKPTAVTVVKATANNITFEVACASCIFEKEDGLTPKPENLTVLGFVFEVVPHIEGYDVPYWANATRYPFDISQANETTFIVDGLDKSTKYNVRVATRNLAGYSDWFDVPGSPETTDGAAALTNSIAILAFALIASLCH